MPTPILMSWSSGKDSAWALHTLRQQPNPEVEVVALFTTYSSTDRRVPIQYTRIELVLAQARALGLPLVAAPLPNPCSIVDYESAVNAAMMDAMADHGVAGIAFADLHLEDIRKYREQLFGVIGLTCHFPLWGQQPLDLAQAMVTAGHKTWITAVDTSRLPASFCGRAYDAGFLADLPPGIDPCGEYGEFHTLCYGGPVFGRDLQLVRGPVMVQGSYAYQDFLPGSLEIGVEDEHLPPPDTSKLDMGEVFDPAHAHMERPAVVRPSAYNLPSVKVGEGGAKT